MRGARVVHSLVGRMSKRGLGELERDADRLHDLTLENVIGG
jgi:hypothetical protein